LAKGKKTVIKEIKLIDDEVILINGKEYIILEGTSDIETATTMKISSNGNRLLRFKDENKKASIDVKRNIDVVKVTITDNERAKKFKKAYDKSLITQHDNKKVLETANSFSSARKIVIQYTDKKSKMYDPLCGKNTFYFSEEVK